MTLTSLPGATSKIEDYALIGDCRTAALVSKSGSIDWLCLPQFDSPSCFNRLMDQWRGGHVTITPLRPYAVRRVYKDSTAVLVTEFQTDEEVRRVVSKPGRQKAPEQHFGDLHTILGRPTRLNPKID